MLNAQTSLLLTALLGIGILVLLITRFQLPAFIALFLVSLAVGAAAGLPLASVPGFFIEGMGAVLGAIALIIGLGSVLGRLLAESGGAAATAGALMRWFGPSRLPWAMGCAGFIVGLPTWFSVGLVLLAPVLYSVARPGLALHLAGIPMVIGLAIAHGLVPPHPGPMYAVAALKADAGRCIFYSLCVGIPVFVITGPLLGAWWTRRCLAPRTGASQTSESEPVAAAADLTRDRPPLWILLGPALLPIVIMLGASAATLIFPDRGRWMAVIRFVGDPNVAMLAGVLVALPVTAWAARVGRSELLRQAEASLAPVAGALLVVGAGGGFGRVLLRSGVGDAVAAIIADWQASPLVLGWTLAALLRLAVGSATVAVTTATGLVLPLLTLHPETNRELLVIAMGAGSSICSHVNDGGFWFVKEYLRLTPGQTLRTFTVLTTVFGVLTLPLTLLLDRLLRAL